MCVQRTFLFVTFEKGKIVNIGEQELAHSSRKRVTIHNQQIRDINTRMLQVSTHIDIIVFSLSLELAWDCQLSLECGEQKSHHLFL